MPYGLFDYVPDSLIRTMGETPLYDPCMRCKTAYIRCDLSPNDPCCTGACGANQHECRVSTDQAKCSAYWLANKCVVNYESGRGITSVQCPPLPPPQPPQPPQPPNFSQCQTVRIYPMVENYSGMISSPPMTSSPYTSPSTQCRPDEIWCDNIGMCRNKMLGCPAPIR